MRSREPWQSRSPTPDGVTNSAHSTTLGKTGRNRGPHHSYGRGLPVKRKALIILTVAILAFAMIPAIGAGAQSATSGVVKIVTPDQLANPSGKTGSTFDKLTGATYVSDTTGTEGMLEDAGGTLYVVVEDNDPAANPLTIYNAYFSDPPLGDTQGGEPFDLTNDDDSDNTTSQSVVAQVADSDGNPTQSGGAIALPAGIKFGDRNRDGKLDHNDITVSVGSFTAATAVEDDASTPNVDESKVGFGNSSNLPDSVFIRFAEDNTAVFLNTGIISAGSDVRINFASAMAGDLNYDDPDNTPSGLMVGDSRIQVTSSSGESIRVEAREKNLAGFSGDAVTQADIDMDMNMSRDSGVFVGIFGVIRNDFKEAIDAWTAIPTMTMFADGDEDTDNNAAEFTVGQGGLQAVVSTSPAGAYVTTLTITGLGENSVLDEKSVKVMVTTGRDTPGTADAMPALSVESVQVGTAGVAAAVLITTTASGAVTGVTTGATQDGDMFTVSYTVNHPNDNISNLITSINMVDVDSDGELMDVPDQSVPFGDFCDSSKDKDWCSQRVALTDALEAHRNNLGLGTSDDASALVGSLIGVEHGDTLSVRYTDASPRATRTASAKVDLVAPTIGGESIANNAYIPEDDFSFFFSVTDADSGIPEDAHEADPAIRDGLPYVSQASSAGATTAPNLPAHTQANNTEGGLSGGDSAEIDVDDQIDDGERYEIEFDVTQTVDGAEGDENTEAQTVQVKLSIMAYDLARNMAKKTYTFTVDDIDPELMKALTGVSVTANKDGGSFDLNAQNRKSIVLVFDDAVAGNDVNAQDISVSGNSVASVTWLDNSNGNNIGAAGSASSDIRKDLGVDSSTDARHLLFLTLDTELATDARPSVDIDNGDLKDLAGNESRSDHTAKPVDTLNPVFTVTVESPLSKDALDVTIMASEELDRSPSARLIQGDADDPSFREQLRVTAGGENTWTVSTNRKAENLGGDNKSGIYMVDVSGRDTNGNVGSNAKAKWELDTVSTSPARVYNLDAMAKEAQPIEINDVVFLNFDFTGEATEYTGDTKKMVTVTGLGLEGLSAGSLDSKDMLKDAADVEVTETWEVADGAAQSSNHVRYVVALSDLAIGNYRLNVDFMDEAGNEGKFGYVFKITAPAPASVAVNPGWSLISIPGTPQDKSIDGVLEGSMVTDVWSLNNETKIWEFARKDADSGEWMGTLTQIVDGRGYFVRSTTFDPVKVLTERFSPQRTPSQYTVTAGWNSIGYTPAGNEMMVPVDAYLSALGNSGWGMIRMWNSDATPPQYETYFSNGTATDGFSMDDHRAVVEKGKGYLLFATRDGVIGG